MAASAYTTHEVSEMKRFKCITIMGIIFVLATGSLAHFVYGWTENNRIAGLFTPVNESVWEHMKLLFFPMLLYAFFMIWLCHDRFPCVVSGLCFGIAAGTILIPVLFYAYTSVLGKNTLVLDIGTFALSAGAGFWIVYRLTLSCRLKRYTLLGCVLTGVLFVCFLWFTYHPLELKLFEIPD